MKIEIDGRTVGRKGAPKMLLNGIPIGTSIDLTADESRMVYDRGQDRTYLWTARLPASESGGLLSTQRMAGGSGFDRSPAVSPDGRLLAFVRGAYWGHADVYVQPVDGGDPTRVTSLGAGVTEVRWSPDGRQLALTVGSPDSLALMVVSLDDRSPRRVIVGLGFPTDHQFAWIEDSSIVYVAFSDTGSSARSTLRAVNPMTGKERTIALPSDVGRPAGVVGSPDGSRLLVQALGSVDTSPHWIVITLRDGEATPIPEFESWTAAWTIKGRIFGLRQRPDHTEVWSVLATGSRPTLEARVPVVCSSLAFPSNASFVVCEQWILESDIWMVENFDPEAGRR